MTLTVDPTAMAPVRQPPGVNIDWTDQQPLSPPASTSTGGGGGGLAVTRRSGDWFFPFDGGYSTGGTGNQNQIYIWPWVCDGNLTVAAMAFEVTTGMAASTLGLLIYADDGTGYPGALLYNTAQVPTNATGVQNIPVVSGPKLTAGTLYWIGHLTQGATGPTIRVVLNTTYYHGGGNTFEVNSQNGGAPTVYAQAVGVIKSSVSGAPPNPFGAIDAIRQTNLPSRLMIQAA